MSFSHIRKIDRNVLDKKCNFCTIDKISRVILEDEDGEAIHVFCIDVRLRECPRSSFLDKIRKLKIVPLTSSP